MGMEERDLRKLFETFGIVADVYLAKKLSKLGKKFAFVKFLKVIDEKVLERKMGDICVGSYHLFVSLAKFHQYERKYGTKPNVSEIRKNKM